MKIDVVVLAGGDAETIDPSLRGPKSLVEIAGRPMISYVMEALRGCDNLGEVVVTVPRGCDPERFAGQADRIVTGAAGVVDAIDKAIKIVGDDGFLLIVSSDTPLITSPALVDFLKRCTDPAVDIFYSIISAKTVQAVYPDTKRTYIRLRDGAYTGGNVHLTRKETFLQNQDIGKRMFDLRKNPVGMVRVLGLSFIVKYFFHTLTIGLLEQKAGALLSAKVKAVVTGYPELGVDVDKLTDLELADRVLSKKTGN